MSRGALRYWRVGTQSSLPWRIYSDALRGETGVDKGEIEYSIADPVCTSLPCIGPLNAPARLCLPGEVKGHTFFVDNGLHSGASGGPVVDAGGEVFGVVTERSITRLGHGPQPELLVPAGSTHAMTIEPLLAIK